VKRELLIGSGPSRLKKIVPEGSSPKWEDLTTLDMDPNCGASVIWDLEKFPYPFEDNTFDEVHAYDVLEHLGTLGDYRFFFKQFEEMWRIMKNGGHLFACVPGPKSPWLWGDPGHRRIITPEMLQFLEQDFYEVDENGRPKKVQSTFYQSVYHGNFKPVSVGFEEDFKILMFMLKAIK
jgi:predicted SAM-dependent methyltransferase